MVLPIVEVPYKMDNSWMTSNYYISWNKLELLKTKNKE